MIFLLVIRRKIFDEYNQEMVEVTKEEAKVVHRMLEGKAPHADFDPYAVRRSVENCSFHSIYGYQYLGATLCLNNYVLSNAALC